MGNSAASAIVFVISSIAQLYLLVLLLRLLLPWLGIPYNNPVSQGILKLTSPVVIPVRRLLPPIGKIDTATLLVAFVIQFLTICLVMLILGRTPAVPEAALTAVVDLVILGIRLFVFAIIIRIVLSWLGGGGYNPAIQFVDALTEPVLRPFRRMIPPIGGIDISPVFAIIMLSALGILVGGFRLLPY